MQGLNNYKPSMKSVIIIYYRITSLTGWQLLGLAARHPVAVLELPVAVVSQHDVHEHVVLTMRLQSRQAELQRREHPPETCTGREVYRVDGGSGHDDTLVR